MAALSVPDKGNVGSALVADGSFACDSFTKASQERTVDGKPRWAAARNPFCKRSFIDDFQKKCVSGNVGRDGSQSLNWGASRPTSPVGL